MHDIKLIRQDPEAFDNLLEKRGKPPLSSFILSLDTDYRSKLTVVQDYQTQRNSIAKQFGEAKRKGEDTTSLSLTAENIKQQLATLEGEVSDLQNKLTAELSTLPNGVDSTVPMGLDETQNIELRRVGTPPVFTFIPRPHFELGEALGLMDFERATKLSGSRFVVLSGQLARLERALADFMLDIHTKEFGYEEISPPLLATQQTLFRIGQLPKFQEDLFQTTTGHYLIPTAEVVLTNLVAAETRAEADLPLRYTAYTPCFRSEAGAAGRDTRGMIRQHQFGKVELVSIVAPHLSTQEHERMTTAAETILQRLGLAYRVMLLCSGDMGFCAQKTYDLEVWLPAQALYREISSCSNCGDFQARRMGAKYRISAKDSSKSETHYVHTLNGSGLAVGRTLVAILENYQQEDGSIKIPTVLIPYMRGIEIIEKKE